MAGLTARPQAPSGCSTQSPEKIRLDCPRHVPVRNARIRKFLTLCNKAVALVEADGMRLGIEPQPVIAAPARAIDQKLKNGAADTAPAPITPHRHSPDMAIRQEPSGADRIALRIVRERMHRNPVKLIPLQ